MESNTKNRKTQIITTIVVIALALGGSYYYVKNWMNIVYTNDAFVNSYRIDLSTDLLLRLMDLRVDEGDRVKKGEILAVMQQDILDSEREENKALVESATKNIEVKKAFFEKIQNDYTRATQSIEDEIISAQEFDHIEKDFETAKAEYQKAIADQYLAKTKVNVVNSYLHHTYIYAPFDGVISKRWVWEGDVIRQGQPMLTMYDRERVWILANLSEKKIEHVKIGDPVDIHIDAYPGKTFRGKVFVIKSAAASQFSVIPQNNATGNYTKVAQRIPIKISIESPSIKDLYIFPGMNAEVKIHVDKNNK